MKHFNVNNPSKAAIRVLISWPDLPTVAFCKHCDGMYCGSRCPTGAITRSEDGRVLIDADRCLGPACRECVGACPEGGLFVHPDVRAPIKCDLCGGDPECVKWCPTGCLRYGGE
ncbi:TPA: 4Fe-4S dicluster domain-containing protein [Candidatus Bathyarchaeota archaeon]|nr:4Fe-4S dicluster domain-containing protein [Candidatus Bathyarchaeota archaeon]